MPGQHDRITGVLHRGSGLHEQHWILGRGRLALFGVTAIVQADAKQVPRRNRREQFVWFNCFACDFELAEDVAGDFASAAVGLQHRVVDFVLRGLVADDFRGLVKGSGCTSASHHSLRCTQRRKPMRQAWQNIRRWSLE